MARWRGKDEEKKVETEGAPSLSPPPVEKDLEALLKAREEIEERIARIKYQRRLVDLHTRIVAAVNSIPRPTEMILHALEIVRNQVLENDRRNREG